MTASSACYPVNLSQAQRRVIAEILPHLVPRLKLNENSQRTIGFTLAELKVIQELAASSMASARTGMVRNSLRHVADFAKRAVDDATGVGAIRRWDGETPTSITSESAIVATAIRNCCSRTSRSSTTKIPPPRSSAACSHRAGSGSNSSTSKISAIRGTTTCCSSAVCGPSVGLVIRSASKVLGHVHRRMWAGSWDTESSSKRSPTWATNGMTSS